MIIYVYFFCLFFISGDSSSQFVFVGESVFDDVFFHVFLKSTFSVPVGLISCSPQSDFECFGMAAVTDLEDC